MISELVALAHPVVPVGNGLVDGWIVTQGRQLGKRYGQIALGLADPDVHVGAANLIGRHAEYLDHFALCER